MAGIAAFVLAPQGGWKTAAGVLGAAWVGFGTLRFLVTRWTQPGARLTREMLGMSLAHFGIAVFLVGALLMALGGLVTATDRRFRQPARAARQEAA